MPPTMIVSDRAIEAFTNHTYVSKVGIKYEEEYQKETENALMKLMNDSSYYKDLSFDSKIEEAEDVEKAQGNMMGVGIGVVLILALIGILNYVNTMTGNIQSRQTELAILESVGMTEKQMRRMLMIEGLLFAGISLFLTATIGTAVTYYLYQSMNYRGVPFMIPIFPVFFLPINRSTIRGTATHTTTTITAMIKTGKIGIIKVSGRKNSRSGVRKRRKMES